jgi:predicted DNA-binding protein (MmcQ/YjbR family)
MNRTDVRTYCLTKPGAWIDQPWEGDEVVKVADKIFAFLGSLDGATVGLKCGRNADEARDWREEYPEDAAVSAYIGRYGWTPSSSAGPVPTPNCGRRSTRPMTTSSAGYPGRSGRGDR